MTKRVLQIAVLAALVAAAFLLRGRGRLPETPKAAVGEFFDAAERGDAGAYLRLTSGPLRKSFEQTRSELGAEAFRRSLQRSVAGVKALAIMGGDDAPSGSVAVEVDIVFVDRVERQKMTLTAQGSGWLISSIETARASKPPVSYGQPVFEEQPLD